MDYLFSSASMRFFSSVSRRMLYDIWMGIGGGAGKSPGVNPGGRAVNGSDSDREAPGKGGSSGGGKKGDANRSSRG